MSISVLEMVFHDQIFSLKKDEWEIFAGQTNQLSEVKFSCWKNGYQFKSQLASMLSVKKDKWQIS